jgi:signal transduction histidine kinase
MTFLTGGTLLPPDQHRGMPGQLLLLAAFFGAYLFLDWLSYLHPLLPFRITPWNPQPAVAIALLMLFGQRWLPAVVATVISSELILRGPPDSPLAVVSASLVLSLGYAAIAYALTRTFPIRRMLDDQRDVMRLTAVVTFGALVTGAFYIGSLLAGGIGTPAHFPEALLSYWVGESVGILVTLPLLLMLSIAGRRKQCRDMFLRWETGAQAVAVILALWFVFGRHAEDHFKYFYVLFLPLMWMAARSGMMGAALAAMVIQSGVILGIYFAGHRVVDVFDLQGLLIALSITGFFLGVTVDERERAASELRQSLKLAAAAEMAAALAHELNQPLAALTSYARASQLIVESPDSRREQLVETLGKLGAEAKRAAEVVRRLRDFFRDGARRLERVSIEKLLDRVLGSFEQRAAAGGVTLRRDVSSSIPALAADPLQIEVVLRNLLANALDAVASVPEGSRDIVVEIRHEPPHVHVRVLDSGPGIAEGDAGQLFEAFASTKATGMGVGLALSRAVVEAHGGRLWAVPGIGGELCFTLPVVDDSNG